MADAEGGDSAFQRPLRQDRQPLLEVSIPTSSVSAVNDAQNVGNNQAGSDLDRFLRGNSTQNRCLMHQGSAMPESLPPLQQRARQSFVRRSVPMIGSLRLGAVMMPTIKPSRPDAKRASRTPAETLPARRAA